MAVVVDLWMIGRSYLKGWRREVIVGFERLFDVAVYCFLLERILLKS